MSDEQKPLMSEEDARDAAQIVNVWLRPILIVPVAAEAGALQRMVLELIERLGPATIREQAETIERLTREADALRANVALSIDERDTSRAESVKLAERVRGLREAWTDLLHEVERGESWAAKGGAAKAAMVPLLSNLRPSIRSHLKSAVRAALANGEG